MKKFILIIAMITLSACQTTGAWTQAGAQQTEVQQAMADCRFKAKSATASMTNGMMAGAYQSRLYQECMTAKGYQYVQQK